MRRFQKVGVCGVIGFFLGTVIWAQTAFATHKTQVIDEVHGPILVNSADIVVSPPDVGFLFPHCHAGCDAALGHADPGTVPGHGRVYLFPHEATSGREQFTITGNPPALGEDGVPIFRGGDESSRGRVVGYPKIPNDPRFNPPLLPPSDPNFIPQLFNGVGDGALDNLFGTSCSSGGCDLFASGFGPQNPIFTDGFESGDTSAWSTSGSGNPPQGSPPQGNPPQNSPPPTISIDDIFSEDSNNEPVKIISPEGVTFVDPPSQGTKPPSNERDLSEFEGPPLLGQWIGGILSGEIDLTKSINKLKESQPKPETGSQKIPETTEPPNQFENAFDFILLGGIGLEARGLEEGQSTKFARRFQFTKKGTVEDEGHRGVLKALEQGGRTKNKDQNSTDPKVNNQSIAPVDDIHSVIKEVQGMFVLS